MKPTARLDSAVFQLTPTRTRFDLVITANGKSEKIATGLLNPFLAHLKTAQEQIAKGGYSIALEPESGSDRTWFTKGTVERFVRFVSTPEILERVYTIESEILQIDEAIAIQGNNDLGLSTVEEYQGKPTGSSEGCKPVADANDEKAIVLYKPDSHPPEANDSATKEGNSKVQLLKVLETRKTVLQKEQGMAFARAAAAGFDIDLMAQLVSFAECFGASRLMDACLKFIDLWKQKHETGQWVDVEAAEAMSGRSELFAMNASGIILSSMANNQNESHGDLVSEDNGQGGINAGAEQKHPMGHQVPVGQQEYFQSQFPHPMYPPWPIHSPPGALPVFQPYPGLPYYPGNGPFYPPHYPPADNSHSDGGHRAGKRRQSTDSRDGNSESEGGLMEPSKTKSPGDLELENESWKKAGRSSKKQSGTVVIRNINYIASKGQNSSGSEALSASDSDMDKEMMPNNSLSPKRKGRNARYKDESKLFNKEGANYEKEAEGANWQAFQNFLMKDAGERSQAADQGMFDSEKDVQMRRRKNAVDGDPSADWRYSVEVQDGRMTELHKASGSMTRVLRTSNDEVLTSRGEGHYGRGSTYDQMDIQYTEINGRKVAYRRNTNDDFMITGRETQSHSMSSTDPLAANGFRYASHNFDKSSEEKTDESFIVPFRSMSLDQVGNDGRTAVDINSELPHRTKNSSYRIGDQVNYEPDELTLMPERGTQNSNFGYDPALDSEMQVHVKDAAAGDNRNGGKMADVKPGSKKSEKDRKSKITPDSLDKRKAGGPIRRGKSSKLSPLEDARARAEKLRTYKADLQKMKKEKEEEDRKRLEALKIERQKRIAARASSTAAQSTSSQQSKKLLPTRLSLGSVRGSKFSDSEPGSSSPLQRSKIRTATLGSSASQKASKISKSSSASHMPGNRMTRSASSLSEARKGGRNATSDSKPSMVQIRRLSEPKTTRSPYVASVKTPGVELVSKRKVSSSPESKKISAIINLDRSKAATLPELKIRTSKESSDVHQNKSAPKEMAQKVDGKNDKHPLQSEADDNPVIDKTIVMLEGEKPPLPVVHSSEENMGVQNEHYGSHGKVEKNEMNAQKQYAAIHAPASPTEGPEIKAVQSQIQEQPKFHTVSSAEKEAQNSSSVRTSGKPYQAPYARLSSLEDPCTANRENGKAPSTRLETEPMGVKAQVSGFEDLKLAMIPESLAKVQVKESPKGFKRLLMFAKKNHSSAAGEHFVEADNANVDGSELDGNAINSASSSEVRTLKNQISQDETATTDATSQKRLGNFSLLSPFRSKSSEKKLTSS